MQLILNSTSKCNFACTFCGSDSGCDSNRYDELTSQEVIDYCNEIKPNLIIMNGGDPLMMSPQFYYDILEAIPNIDISFTTNLKDFYLHPDKWTPLFTNPRIMLCTSFNYGVTRKWDPNTVYTEEMLLKVEELCKERLGHPIQFIVVVDKDNEDRVMDTVQLAKRIGTRCRLNNALKLGRQGEYYPRYKMFKIWMDIIEAGLGNYEQNCMERAESRCPQNQDFKCRNHIRLLQKEKGVLKYYSCSNDAMAMRDDIPRICSFPEKLESTMFERCYSCPLCYLCNSCNGDRKQLMDPDTECTPEIHCREMTKMKDRIIKNGWKL